MCWFRFPPPMPSSRKARLTLPATPTTGKANLVGNAPNQAYVRFWACRQMAARGAESDSKQSPGSGPVLANFHWAGSTARVDSAGLVSSPGMEQSSPRCSKRRRIHFERDVLVIAPGAQGKASLATLRNADENERDLEPVGRRIDIRRPGKDLVGRSCAAERSSRS
jgi:hypothetical protein